MTRFIQDLITLQFRLGYTDQEMATKMGVSRQWFNTVRNSQMTPGIMFFRKAAKAFRAFPELVDSASKAALDK